MGLPVTVYTYGSPRVGDEVFRKTYVDKVDRSFGNSTVRVVNVWEDDGTVDFVSEIPPAAMEYTHVVPKYSIYSPQNLGGLALHYRENYNASVIANLPSSLKSYGAYCRLPPMEAQNVASVPANISAAAPAGGPYAYYSVVIPPEQSIVVSVVKKGTLQQKMTLVSQYAVKPTVSNFVKRVEAPGEISMETCNRTANTVAYFGVLSDNLYFASEFDLTFGGFVECPWVLAPVVREDFYWKTHCYLFLSDEHSGVRATHQRFVKVRTA